MQKKQNHNKGKVLRHYMGHSSYEYPYKRAASAYQTLFVITLSVAICLGLMVYDQVQEPIELLSPIPVQAFSETVMTQEIVIDKDENIDNWVGEAVDHFFTSKQQRSEARMIMHCLLNRESAHGANTGHGDNGRAGGILQFWEGTWEGYRKLMISEGYARDISNRYNDKDAIYTTVWALKTNRGKAWGPIYRELTNYKYSDKPGCQIPSWSVKAWK